MEIVTLLFILSLFSLMIWDCTRLGIVDDFEPVSATEFIKHLRKCRKVVDGKFTYSLGLPRNEVFYGSRVNIVHNVNTQMYIKTWIDTCGDLIEVFYREKSILEYVDQDAQSKGLMGINDATVHNLFYDRQVQKMLRDVILVGEITNGINDFKEKYPNAF